MHDSTYGIMFVFLDEIRTNTIYIFLYLRFAVNSQGRKETAKMFIIAALTKILAEK